MHKITCVVAAMACSISLTALADSGASSAPQEGGATAIPTPELSSTAEVMGPVIPPAERPFLFTTDPSLPAPGHVIVSVGMGNITQNTGEERPIGSGSVLPTAGVEVGLLDRLSFFVDTGYVFWSSGTTNVSPVTLDVGAHILLTNPTSKEFHLALKASYGLDFYGNSTLLMNAALAWNSGILRVVASGLASHTFQSDADSVDVTATVGASVKLPLGFLVGAEGVVTDLEEIANPEAEGGASAFAGPTVGWEWNHFFQVVAGPGFGGGPNYSGTLFRLAASAQF